MNINSIEINNYKAFYGKQKINIEGKNLFIYGENTAHLEREIDQLVYALYGLTDKEIKIIEGK